MKTLIVALILALQPIASFANTITEAQALEAQMDQVKPDFQNQKTIDQQIALVNKASRFVTRALSVKHLSSEAALAVARIMVRNFAYDQANALAGDNYNLIERHADQLEQAFQQLERTHAFDAKTIETTRITIGIAGNVQRRGTDSVPNTEKPAPGKNKEPQGSKTL